MAASSLPIVTVTESSAKCRKLKTCFERGPFAEVIEPRTSSVARANSAGLAGSNPSSMVQPAEVIASNQPWCRLNSPTEKAWPGDVISSQFTLIQLADGGKSPGIMRPEPVIGGSP